LSSTMRTVLDMRYVPGTNDESVRLLYAEFNPFPARARAHKPAIPENG
jgi:hypothetical protein